MSNIVVWITGLGTLGGVVVAGYQFFFRLDRIEGRLRSLEKQTATTTRVLGQILTLGATYNMYPQEKILDLLLSFNPAWEAEVAEERSRLNPLTREELNEFEALRVKVMERQVFLNTLEAQRYNALVKKLQEDKPADPHIGELLALGALLLALALLVATSKE